MTRSESTNGVDDLRFLLLVSQVNVVDSVDELIASCPQFNLKAEVTFSHTYIILTRTVWVGHIFL